MRRILLTIAFVLALATGRAEAMIVYCANCDTSVQEAESWLQQAKDMLQQYQTMQQQLAAVAHEVKAAAMAAPELAERALRDPYPGAGALGDALSGSGSLGSYADDALARNRAFEPQGDDLQAGEMRREMRATANLEGQVLAAMQAIADRQLALGGFLGRIGDSPDVQQTEALGARLQLEQAFVAGQQVQMQGLQALAQTQAETARQRAEQRQREDARQLYEEARARVLGRFAMTGGFFQGADASYRAAFIDGSHLAVENLLHAVAPIFAIVATGWIMAIGVALLFGGLNARDGIDMIVRLFVTQILLTAAFYNRFVTDVMLDWLPGWIAESVGNSGGQAPAAAQFDRLRDEIIAVVSQLTQQLGLSDIALSITIRLLGVACEITIALAFFVWEFASALTALLVAIGPFILLFNLFKQTRPFVERWVGKLVGNALVLLLLAVLLRILLRQYDEFLTPLVVQPGPYSPDAGTELLLGALMMLGFGVACLFYLPTLAFAIGGGIAFSVAAGVSAAGAGAAAAARGAQAAAGAAKATVKAARTSAVVGTHLGHLAASKLRGKP